MTVSKTKYPGVCNNCSNKSEYYIRCGSHTLLLCGACALILGVKLTTPAQDEKKEVTKAIKLLKFWVNDFYDSFNRSNRYEERHKALVETEQFIKEVTK